MRRRRPWITICLVVQAFGRGVQSMCPNSCNRRGDCNPFGRCDCWDGWDGADCSERTCSTGLAWSDRATGTDTAHGISECSNRGECDRASGRCKCMSGFSGAACERTNCPRGCSGHGHCRSLSDYAEHYRGAESIQYLYSDVWDSEKLHTCICDAGYHGFDCSLRTCPTGDDPLTTDQVNEVQLIACEVEFLGNFGPLRPMWSYNALVAGSVTTLTIVADGSSFFDSDAISYASIKGTKENAECSNRGICDAQEGFCECFISNDDIFASSDGYNGPGTRGDCGYQVTTTAGCPGEIACSGHGTCDESDFTCDCNDGWTTGDCSLRACPYGWSWFSYPSAEDKAHDERTECSDGGLCNRETGVCECGDLFHGAACEYMICSGGTTDACHGHGRCMTMAELALEAENNGDATDFTYGEDPYEGSTWDAHRIFGCHCDEGYSGYDCSERVCPTGDDPGSWNQEPEIQDVSCQATNGTFTLTFRQAETEPIPTNASRLLEAGTLQWLSTWKARQRKKPVQITGYATGTRENAPASQGGQAVTGQGRLGTDRTAAIAYP